MTKKSDYIETTFEIDGIKYKATELPFDHIRDFSDLEFNLPAQKCSPIYAAMIVTQKTNSQMEKGVPKSPTYPIKENDLIWIALTNYKKDSRDTPQILNQVFPQPFVIQTDPNGKLKATTLIEIGHQHTHISSDTLANFISPLKQIGYAGVRLYRHVDRTAQPKAKATEAIEPIFEFETQIVHNPKIDNFDIDNLSLDELIEKDMKDDTLERITQRIRKDDIKPEGK